MSQLSALGAAHLFAGQLPVFAGAVQGYATTAWMRSLERSELIAANLANPNVAPGADELLETYFKGGCTLAELNAALKFCGIAQYSEGSPFLTGIMWEKIIDIKRPRLPLDVLLRADALGYSTIESLDKSISRMGYRFEGDRTLLTEDSHPFDIATLWQFMARGLISPEEWVKFMRHAGWRDNTFLELMIQWSQGIDPQSALTLLNRGLLDSNDVKKYQEWAGYRDQSVKDALTQLRWQWPSVASISLWSQLGVFNEETATKLKLDDEKPASYYAFARANGQHWSAGDTPPETWPIPNTTPADLAWRGHWRANDIATAIVMLHRLRPSADDPTQSNIAGIPAYAEEDFKRDLAANGIPPGRRDQIRAVTYSLPRFTVFRTALSAGTITKDGVVSRLQDSGYSPDTAKLLADTWEHQSIQKQVDKLRPISLSQVKEAYRLGTISRQRAAIGLYMIYLDDYAQVQTFLGLPADAQLNLASDNGFVQLALTSIDADVAGELAKQAVEVVRKAYLRLEITSDQAIGQLVTLGIVYARAVQYVQLWSYEHAAMGVEATAATLRGWYIDHLIDQATYAARLQLLGYGVGDIALMVAAANLSISEKAAALQAKTVRAQQMQAKQLAAALKASQQQQKAIQKQMCSSGTRNQVADWTIKGYITYYDGYQRLVECGMRPDDAVNLLAAKQPKKGGLTRDQIEEKITGKSQTTSPAPAGSGT